MSVLKVSRSNSRGFPYYITDPDDTMGVDCVVARVKSERLARQFAASDRMLAVLIELVDCEQMEDEAGYLARRDVVDKAREIVEGLER